MKETKVKDILKRCRPQTIKTKWLLLVCACIVIAAITVAILLITNLDYDKYDPYETLAENKFIDLHRRATSTPPQIPPAPRQALAQIAPAAEQLEEEPIILLTVAEKIQVLYEIYGITVPEKNLNFDVLHEENEHIYAWIYIPNTRINYPILQHPTDHTFYLYHNLDGRRGYPGCIYTEFFNTKTFLDRMTVVYGHNMRNGTMFSDLHLFANADFFENNQHIFIYTENDIFVYRIFSAHQTNDDHILLSLELFDDNNFLEYLNAVTDTENIRGNVNTDIVLTVSSRIITLSTCVAGRQNERFLVQGVLIKGENFY